MQRDPRAFLWDARESALAIQGFIAGMNAGAYLCWRTGMMDRWECAAFAEWLKKSVTYFLHEKSASSPREYCASSYINNSKKCYDGG